MSQTSANSVQLRRVLRAPAERVYRAFLEPDALCRWLPPFGYLGKIHQSDVREGGGYQMSFTNFGAKSSHSFTAKFVELIENQRVVSKVAFDDPGMPGEMRQTVQLKSVSCGTMLDVEQVDLPAGVPAEMCYLGWQESLIMLARLVEPEIPAGA